MAESNNEEDKLIHAHQKLNMDKEDSDKVGAGSRPVPPERDMHNRVEQCWNVAKIEVKVIKGLERQTSLFDLNVELHKLQFLVKYKAAALNNVLKKSEFVLDKNNSVEHLTVSSSSETDLKTRVEKTRERLDVFVDVIFTKDLEIQESKLLFIINDFFSEIQECGIEKRMVQVMRKSKDCYCVIGEDNEKVELVESLLKKHLRNITVENFEDRELFENLDIRMFLKREFPKLEILFEIDSTHVEVGMKGDREEAKRSAAVLKNIKNLQPDALVHKRKEIQEELHNLLARGSVHSRISDYLRKKTLRVHWTLKKEEMTCYLNFYVLSGEDMEKCIECFLKEVIPEVRQALKMEQQENQIFPVTVEPQRDSSIINGKALEASSREKNENVKKETLMKSQICHIEENLKVRKDITYKYLESEVAKLEKQYKCKITFLKSGPKEPQYHTCCNAPRQCLTVAEGDIENAVCDAMVCFIDDDCQPVGESTIQIFRKGGWEVIQEDAIKSKKEATNASKSSTCVYSSSNITALNCRTVFYVHAKIMYENPKRVWDEINYDQIENQWSRVCFPADFPPFTDASLKELLNAFGQSDKTLLKRVEVLICNRSQENLKRTLKICEDFNMQKSFWVDFSEVNFMKGKMCTKSPIKMSLEDSSIIDIAKKGQVNVIVNSSNLDLNLDEGYISKEILKYGGKSVQEECDTHYPDGINYGEIAFTTGGNLPCIICHGALYPRWIYEGDFSLKILSAFVKRCLQHTDAKKMTSIAFPALGTGKLGYPYLQVARTMVRAVNEYGQHFPDTGIQSVQFVLQSSEKECFEAFKNALDSDRCQQDNQGKVEEMFSIQDVLLLDTRVQDHDLVIQLMSADASAYVDDSSEARLYFYKDTSKNKGKGSEIDFSWSVDEGCYTREICVSEKKSKDCIKEIKDMTKKSFQMLEKRRITSVLIDVAGMKEIGISHALYEVFKDFVPFSFSESMTGSVRGKKRNLRVLKIIVDKSEFAQLLGGINGTQEESFVTKFFSWLMKEKVEYKKSVKRSERDFVCCIYGGCEDLNEKIMGELRGHFERRVKTGNWCEYSQEDQLVLLSTKINTILTKAEENGNQHIDINIGCPLSYNFEESLRTHNQGDRHSEKIVWIEGGCVIPEQLQAPVWCVHDQEKCLWRFLNPEANKILNDVADQQGMSASIADVDGIIYKYNLNDMMRQDHDKKYRPEKIYRITEFEDINHARHKLISKQVHIVPVKNADENDLQIFEFVTGVVYQEKTGKEIEEIRKKANDAGCEVKEDRTSKSLIIKGSLTQVLEVNKQLTAVDEISSSPEPIEYIIKIDMSERDFKVFSHFADKCHWFKHAGNKMHHDGHNLICIVSVDEGKSLEKNMKDHFDKIRMMNTDHTVLADSRGVNINQIMQDIESEYPKVFLLLQDNTVEIICDSYTDLLKIKGLLQQKMSGKVNRRANRTFAKTEEERVPETQPKGDTYQRRFFTDGNFENKFPSDSTRQTMPLKKYEFKAKEGLMIMIYEGSITRLDVDCIVNAANENLMHGGGVAAAISEAAGYAFDDESKDYIAKFGPIPVGTCAVTSAGRLPYKYVIHTVGPRWGDYVDKDRCLDDLQKSVEVTFRKADNLGMNSTALPAISSGIFAVPRDKCVEQYYKAVMTFSRSYPFRSLKEIHFVDRDPSMVSAIQAIFQERASSSSYFNTTVSSEVPESGEALPPGDKKISSAHGSEFSKHPLAADSIIKISDRLTIKVHLGNITDVTADIVVCPQDESCSSRGQVARGIFKMLPSEPLYSGKKPIGQIFSQFLYENSPWRMIIHAVTPRWNRESAKDNEKFERTLNIMIQRILKTADESKYTSISVPLLGAGVDDYLTPMETCARNMFKAVKATHSSLIHLKEIYLVVKDEAAEKAYLETFEERGFQVIPKTLSEASQPGTLQSGNKTDWGKTIKSSDLPQEQENCCVCMDTPTNPKRLKKCGHIFCKECIEQYFEYKPVCPSCGQIYGKMMGDQPPGTMSMSKGHQRLEGFTDCNGCIIVTYTFHSGSQGSDHPSPGKWYKGISRSGYVPNNERGRLIAKLLNVAFSRRLVFTIGRSRTTGQDGVITWNDIHHKTRPDGGPQRFGYPDSTYLDRVLEELAAKGVTPESADDLEEYKEYSNFVKYYR